VVESEREAKLRKAKLRELVQRQTLLRGLEEVKKIPEDEAREKYEKILKDLRGVENQLRSHPRNKSLNIVCESFWRIEPLEEIPLVTLTIFELHFVVGQPDLPKVVGLRNFAGEYGYADEFLYHGERLRAPTPELIEKLTKRGELLRKPILRCICGREVRFESVMDFLECVKVILILRRKEASLALFQEIKNLKGQTRS